MRLLQEKEARDAHNADQNHDCHAQHRDHCHLTLGLRCCPGLRGGRPIRRGIVRNVFVPLLAIPIHQPGLAARVWVPVRGRWLNGHVLPLARKRYQGSVVCAPLSALLRRCHCRGRLARWRFDSGHPALN